MTECRKINANDCELGVSVPYVCHPHRLAKRADCRPHRLDPRTDKRKRNGREEGSDGPEVDFNLLWIGLHPYQCLATNYFKTSISYRLMYSVSNRYSPESNRVRKLQISLYQCIIVVQISSRSHSYEYEYERISAQQTSARASPSYDAGPVEPASFLQATCAAVSTVRVCYSRSCPIRIATRT